MTTPTNAVLDAINDAATAFITIDAAYPVGTAPAVSAKLAAAQSRAAAAFAEIASYHSMTTSALVTACQARPTYTGGINCT